MKRLLFFICTLLCANVLWAQCFSEGDLRYCVTGAGEVTVYGNYYDNSSVTSVNIPSSVTKTWKHYSYSCNCYITDSVRTYSVTSIGDDAFEDWSSLTSVTIPNSVTSIGNHAFYWCSSLTSVTIPNSVTSIGNVAFYRCISLTSVTIGNSVTSIGAQAFEECSSLISVTIPNSVTSIGHSAFAFCTSLTTLNFNAINCEAFTYDPFFHPFDFCPITTINIGNIVQRIPENFAYSLDYLTSVTIGNSVTSIGGSAFFNCDSLTSVTIPNSVTSIGNGAFEGCSSLTSITIPNSVTSIGDYAFGNCSSLTSVTIPNSITSIGNEVFEHCHSLTSVTIPNSVTSIGNNAFASCYDLTSVTIPNSVTSIGNNAFQYCYDLTSVTIPNSVTSIGGGVFFYCSSLTSVILSNNITELPCYYDDNGLFYHYNGFFEGCSSLTSVTIPNSVTSIGDWAFASCSSLTSVTCLADIPPALGNNVFNNTPSNKILYVNCGLINDYISSWGDYFNSNNIQEITFDINTYVNNESGGSVAIERNNCSTATLTAIANNCYQFVSWNDGNTENPRVVSLSSDTSFTATFEELPNHNYNVNVSINNDAFGSVSIENDCNSSTLTATANNCYQFVSWNDGNTENPRVVNVSSDTSLTAIFDSILFDTTINATINAGETYAEFGFNESEAGTYVQNLQTEAGCDSTITLVLSVNSSLIDIEETEITFYPNPTDSKITFSQKIEKVEVIDLTGKTIFTFSNAKTINIESLPSGAYYLRLTNEEKTTMQKVIKQ